QEQVMQIAGLMADYSMGEADILRKAMGKKIPEVMAQQKSRFLDGTKKKKIDQKKAEAIFKNMETFGGYGFNKSHSAAYALITYQTAYLKAHYPLDFMVALVTSKMGNSTEVTKCITECREKGIVVLPPDVNLSPLDFAVVEDKIRFGLAAVKNVGAGAIESILEARKKEGAFKSLIDFCQRVDLLRVNRRVVESLIKCGAFDSLGVARARLMAFLPEALEIGQQRQKEQTENQFSLFSMGGDSGLTRPDIEPPMAEEWRESQKLSYEKEILGFYITGHPLTRYAESLPDLKTVDIQALADYEDKENVRLVGMVAALKEINSKKGERMAFATIEDLTGSCEVIIFSDVYRKSSTVLKEEGPLWITGFTTKDEKGIKVIANDMLLLTEAEEKMAQQAVLKIPVEGLTRDRIVELSDFLKGHPGACPVQICACLPDKSQVLLNLPEAQNIRPSARLRRELKGISCHPILEVVYP
ncbi:MAG: OB-fold nucleic acid binding domain-containing protein, partial [Thermodesulfobacteriota bacterium]